LSGENPHEVGLRNDGDRARSLIKRYPKKFQDITSSKVSQSESQKVEYISEIIHVLEKHHEIITRSIKNESGLSWNSVNRTLRLLRVKNIVKWRNGDNNSKIYSLIKDRALVYIAHLQAWKRIKSVSFMHHHQKKLIKQKFGDLPYPSLELGFTDEILTKKITIPPDLQKRFDVIYDIPVIIRELPFQLADKILMDYKYNLKYCQHCFEKGFLGYLKLHNEIFACSRCGIESAYDIYNINNVAMREDEFFSLRRKGFWEEMNEIKEKHENK
jgi:hypothetical protein